MIADTFIKRPVTAIVISIVLVLVGLIAMSTLPISQYPDITRPPFLFQAASPALMRKQWSKQLPLLLKRR